MPLPISRSRLTVGAWPALAAEPAPAGRAPRGARQAPRLAPRVSGSAPRAFTLLEILVAVALLSFILLGLFAMFNQTQRAFRLGMTQSDILEAGRAVTEMLPRELEQTAPSDGNAVNFMATALNSVPLLQSLPGTTLVRTNLIAGLLPVAAPEPDLGGHWLLRARRRHQQGPLAAGNVLRLRPVGRRQPLPLPDQPARPLQRQPQRPANGLPLDPGQLYVAFPNACAPGSTAISNRICDGVVHFRLRAFATNGFPLFSDGLLGNACFRTNSFTPGVSFVAQTLAVPNFGYPDNWSSLYFASNAVPATVELELGLLEQYAWQRYNSLGDRRRPPRLPPAHQ